MRKRAGALMNSTALREVLVMADRWLREGGARNARTVLEEFAAADESAATSADFQALHAESCRQGGDVVMAQRAIDRAIELRPEWGAAHQLRGLVLRDAGLPEEAARAIEHSLQLNPEDARGWQNLGEIQRRCGSLADAEASIRRAIALAPSKPGSWRGLAEVLQAAGQDDSAVDAWRQWVVLSANSVAARETFGWALAKAHRWAEAEAELAIAVASPETDTTTATRLAFVRRERGDADGALAGLALAVCKSPDSLTARIGHALFLPQVYENGTDVVRWRNRYALGLGELDADLGRLRAAPGQLWELDWSNFYLAYQGLDDLALQRQYSHLLAELARAAAPEWAAAPAPAFQGGRRLRVGFASSFFRTCTVGSYFSPWLTDLDRERFDVHAFYFGAEIDSTTRALRSALETFVHTGPRVREIATAIRAARLDVLVYPQLGMDGRDMTLAALRLAPVQCVAWGHPDTTGSATIDCYFSCSAMEPENAATQYSESLLLLPGLGTRYTRPAVQTASRAEFALPEHARLYACPQSLFKIHPDNDVMFAELLARDREAVLVLCADPDQPVTLHFAARMRRAFRNSGIDFERRVSVQPLRDPAAFRAMLSVCDVMLDTLHWSGGNTSLDALAAGLPIVTCEGSLMRGRQSAAMLRRIGLHELVARDPADALRKAVDLASDGHRRHAIRRQIVDRCGDLFDRTEPIRALAEHLLRVCDRG